MINDSILPVMCKEPMTSVTVNVKCPEHNWCFIQNMQIRISGTAVLNSSEIQPIGFSWDFTWE